MHMRASRLILITLLLLSAVALLMTTPSFAWYSGYNYEQTVTIGSSPDGVLSNYQITLNVYADGSPSSDSINTMFLGGHALNFPNDIRFTDNHDVGYNYVIAYSNATFAQYVIRVASIPASGNQLMRVYYGQTGGSSASNAAGTYDYYTSMTVQAPTNTGNWMIDTIGTGPKADWWTVPLHGSPSASGNPVFIWGIGTPSSMFTIGSWVPYDAYSQNGGTYTVVFTDGKTTNNVLLYNDAGSLIGTYSKDFGTSHTLQVGGDNGASPFTTGAATFGPFSAVAYTANPPAMGLWTGEATPATQTVSFTSNVTSGIAPVTILFTGTSNGPVEQWTWDFGDGWQSTGQVVSHTYDTMGSYTVQLTITSAYGTNSTFILNDIQVHSAPVAAIQDIAGANINGQKTYYFYDASAGGPATSWAWLFGDGGSSTQQNPAHSYNGSGTYTVNFTATNEYGSNQTTLNLSVEVDNSITGSLIITNNGVIVAPGTSVKLKDNNGVIVFSSTTDTTGQVTNTGVTPGEQYTVIVSGSGFTTYTGTFAFSATNTKYWVDVGTGQITPDSQKVLTTHTVTFTFTIWFTAPVQYCNVKLFLNGQQAGNSQTDVFGRVSFQVASNTQYLVWINNSTQGVNCTIPMDLSGLNYNPDLTGRSGNGNSGHSSSVDNPTSGLGIGATGDPNQDIITTVNGSVISNGQGNIIMNYTDISDSSTFIEFMVVTQNSTDASQPLVTVYDKVYMPPYDCNNQLVNYSMDNPAGTSYIIYINSTYTKKDGNTGYIYRSFSVAFTGPLRFIPYLPVTWYKYVAIAALLAMDL